MRMYQGPIVMRPGRGQPAQRGLGLGPDGEVVVDHRHLAVEHEVGVRRVGGHRRQQPVEQVDELHAEGLEGPVPLPVPVGVRDDVDGPRHGVSLAARRLTRARRVEALA